ncbi:hypothetical protein IDH44_20765 [Paenibacillus sp. IB182496]|uniref:Uncharacterized protein n=1 Tax=Paenibacillus sabuli TaxID=2772509 RepID=A0A927BXW9_9BACL|nr:hypothetical protein [Paenibacillus sabuli]MBD2847630.1 hypothetical protein [Paenibacillus sabuli]
MAARQDDWLAEIEHLDEQVWPDVYEAYLHYMRALTDLLRGMEVRLPRNAGHRVRQLQQPLERLLEDYARKNEHCRAAYAASNRADDVLRARAADARRARGLGLELQRVLIAAGKRPDRDPDMRALRTIPLRGPTKRRVYRKATDLQGAAVKTSASPAPARIWTPVATKSAVWRPRRNSNGAGRPRRAYERADRAADEAVRLTGKGAKLRKPRRRSSKKRE